MSVRSRTELVAALVGLDFAGVVGTGESDWIDFKSQPYQTDENGRLTERGRWELAKDVACFANASGGLLVLGFQTEKPEHTILEQASAVAPIPMTLINAESYTKVIAAWIYPLVRGVTTTWFESAPSSGRGIFVIDVPSQDDYEKPFLVRKTVDVDGRASESWSASIREGDRCAPIPIERLHAQIATGRLTERTGPPIRDQLDLTERLERLLAAATKQLTTSQPDIATYGLAIVGRYNQPLPDFYSADRGVRQLLLQPPELRPHGFNLAHLGQVTVEDGAFQVGWSGTSVRAEADGTCCVLGAATEDFLGWSVNRRRTAGGPLLLNPLAVVEFTLEATRLAFEIQQRGAVGPGDFSWHVAARGLARQEVRLERGEHRSTFADRYAETASADEWIQEVRPAPTADQLAFNALERFYALFGLGADAIPYTADRKVDSAAIAAIG